MAFPEQPPLLFQRDQLAEQPVVLLGRLDRVDPLEPRLQLDDPAGGVDGGCG